MDLFQIIDPQGKVMRPELVPTDDDLLIELYRAMLRARHFDEKAVTLQRQGKLGVFPPFAGQEGIQVGAALALKPGDWLAPTYRDTAAALTFGLPMDKNILYWRTAIQGFTMCEANILPFYVPIATQLPHVTGLAMAAKLQKKAGLKDKDFVALGFIGDGGSSEGDFHAALNFAGVFKVPAIFVIQNNGFAISVPTHKQTAAETLASRAIGYGIEGIRVDGNDILAVYHVVKQAADKARRGEGPTLIEAMTYRIKPHTTSDDPGRYRTEDEAKLWRERDPIGRLRAFIREKKLWDDKKEEILLKELNEELEQAVKEADSYAEAEPQEIMEHVFAEMPAILREQWEELKR